MNRRRPRYRIGEPKLDQKVDELVDAAEAGENADLITELVTSALRLARDQANRGDLKIANAALKEMRYAFHVFAPYRGEYKASIFGSARTATDDPLYELARRVATALAAADWMVITGAGPGIMSAGIEGAGPKNSFGVNIRLPFEATTSQFLSDDPKLINFRYFFTRKLAFIKESAGFVLLPGGFGTMDEAFELLTLLQTGKTVPAPVVLLDVPGGSYWKSWEHLVRTELLDAGYVSPQDLSLVCVTDDVTAAVNELTTFYANYHSQRFVKGDLLLRVRRVPNENTLAELSSKFADILIRDQLRHVSPAPEEVADEDNLDFERIALRFDRHGWARLRELINELNSF